MIKFCFHVLLAPSRAQISVLGLLRCADATKSGNPGNMVEGLLCRGSPMSEVPNVETISPSNYRGEVFPGHVKPCYTDTSR